MLDIKALIAKILESVQTLSGRPYITSQGTSGEWKYRKWSNGFQEAWCIHSFGAQTGSSWGSGIYYKDVNLAIPSGIFTTDDVKCVGAGAGQQWWFVGYSSSTKTQLKNLRFCRINGTSTTLWGSFYCYAQA